MFGTLGVAFDEGASWIHGIDGNPITGLAQQAGISFHTLDQSRKSYDLGGVLRADSLYGDTEDELDEILDTLMNHGDGLTSFETVFNARYPAYTNDRLWDFSVHLRHF